MLAFLDVNTIWRRKFAEALARRVPGTLLCAPYRLFAPASAAPDELAVALPPGWAGALAPVAMPILRRRIARAASGALTAVVATTPHYRRLLQDLPATVATIYYCSDDYRTYAGWDPVRMTRDEAAICRDATLSIFVSEALRHRAVAEYGLDPVRTLVSPNATEPRFANAPPPPPAIAALPKPVFGTAGIVNARIDLAFLARVAADRRVGSLALVGPIDAAIAQDPALARLRADPKVHVFGPQPHGDMPAWMAGFDVAVIPYADMPFNRFCSPMRLFDHLAIGRPIVATPHCPQVAEHPAVFSGSLLEVPALVGRALGDPGTPQLESWDMRIDALRESAVAAVLFGQ